ncbi:MAG: phosphatase PAP2 family protein, partial [Bdellovibrionota bacterium]
WSFFWVNMLGYSTYYWYAAAPPWFVSDYGLVAARPDVTAHLAGCERFDQLLGTHIFEQMYGRAADVYGAIPSLHVAYPFLAVYFAFRIGTARIFSLAFWGLMFFSAVYLNHHYVLDALWGTVYAVIIGVAMDLCLQREAIR